MGMFTSVAHPDTGEEIQFKCGYDMCERYNVGDTVNWYVIDSWPGAGHLLDGVYDGYPNYWVIIKDHIIVAVEEKEEDVSETAMERRWGIEELPRETWSEKVWEEERICKEKAKKENEEFQASIYHLSGRQRLAASLAWPLRKKMKYSSIARELFTVTPIESDAEDLDVKEPLSDSTSTYEKYESMVDAVYKGIMIPSKYLKDDNDEPE